MQTLESWKWSLRGPHCLTTAREHQEYTQHNTQMFCLWLSYTISTIRYAKWGTTINAKLKETIRNDQRRFLTGRGSPGTRRAKTARPPPQFLDTILPLPGHPTPGTAPLYLYQSCTSKKQFRAGTPILVPLPTLQNSPQCQDPNFWANFGLTDSPVCRVFTAGVPALILLPRLPGTTWYITHILTWHYKLLG